jgi:hypothetical protein
MLYAIRSILLLLLLIYDGYVAATDAPTPHPESVFCHPLQDGCASAAVCECVWFFTQCDLDASPTGQCKLTRYGIVGVVILVVVVLALLTILIGCCLCFCGCRCCKKKKKYDPLPPSPINLHFTSPAPIGYPQQNFAHFEKL